MAANVRRSPNMTLGRLITCVPPSPRTRRKGEHDERQRHEHNAQAHHLPGAVGLACGYELRQEREEEDRQLGVEKVDQHRGTDDPPERHRGAVVLEVDRGLVPQSLPGGGEQVGDPEPLDRLEADRGGVQDRGEPGDRRHHVREDAEGAAERGDDAGPGAAG